MRTARAFTLIEMLVAAALLGLLLLTLNYFIFSMAEIWGHGAERRLFDQHVRAVTREVEGMLRKASLPPAPTEAPLFAREIRLDDGRRTTVLSFEQPEGSPRLPWRAVPLPDVVCSLVVQEGKGLMLYWHSRLEEDFDDSAPRAWAMSPFGTSLTYEYNEADGATWRTYDQLQRNAAGQSTLPARLRLGFTHGTMKTETVVMLPPIPGPLPHF